MLSCQVVSDLMVVYASGEASAETQRLVEEHLAQCPVCREAFGKEAQVEQALIDMGTTEQLANGHRFIARTQRLVFAIGAGTLFLFACVLSAFERVVMREIANIPLLDLPGSELLWLAIGAIALALFVTLLMWRRQGEPGSRGGRVVSSLLTGALLVTIAFATYYITGSGGLPSILAAVSFLLAALITALLLLPRLSHVTLITVLVLFLVNGLLLGQAIIGVATIIDFDWPAELGHPAAEVAPEEAVRVDLSSLKLEWVESTEVSQLNGVELDGQSEGVQARYEDDNQLALLTVIRFEDEQGADSFFVRWKGIAKKGVQIAATEINLPGVQGRLIYTYNPQDRRAYRAWQAGRWITVVEVPGSLSEAEPLAREIKELVAESYNEGGTR